MKPASAMSFALRKPGRSALVCACAGTDFVVVTVITANAAERRRSRFVSISTLLVLRARRPFFQIHLASRIYAPSRRLAMQNQTTQSLPGCPLLAPNGH